MKIKLTSFIKFFITTSFFKLVSRLLVLFSFSLLARSLSIESFGSISFEWVVQNSLAALLVLGGNIAVIKKLYEESIIYSFFTTIISGIIIIAIYKLVNSLIFGSNLNFSLLIIFNSISISLIRIISAQYRLAKRIKECEFFEQFLINFLFLTSILIGLWDNHSFGKIFFLITNTTLFLYLIHYLTIFNLSFRKVSIKRLLENLMFSIKAFSNSFGNYINFNVTRLCSKILVSSSFVAMIQPAFQLAVSLNAISNSLKLTSLSFMQKAEFKSISYINSVNKLISIQLFGSLILMLFSNLLVTTIYGNKYDEYSIYLNILLIGQLASVINGPSSTIMIINKYENFINKVSLVSITINILGNIIALIYHDLFLAVFFTSVSIFAMNFIPFFYFRKNLSFKLHSKFNIYTFIFMTFLNLFLIFFVK